MGREEIFIDLGGGAPKTPIFYAKMSEIRIFTVFAACDAHAGWLADPRPLKMYVVAEGMAPCMSMAPDPGSNQPHGVPCLLGLDQSFLCNGTLFEGTQA